MRILITSLKTNQQKYVICRICPGRDCSQYFSSIKSLTQHKRICSAPRVRKRKQQQVEQQVEEQQQPHTLEEFGFEVMEGVEVLDEFAEEVEDDDPTVDVCVEDEDNFDMEEFDNRPLLSVPSQGVEIIMNLREWLKNPWEKI